MRPLNQRMKILRRLQQGRARSSELKLVADTSQVAPHITRLRNEGYKIASFTTETAGDPAYELQAGPGYFADAFTCPSCKRAIPLSTRGVNEHESACPFALPSELLS